MCGRPPFGKGFGCSDELIGVRSCVRPVSAALKTVGPDEVRRSSPIQVIALIVRCSPLTGFIRSRLDRSSSHPVAPRHLVTRLRGPFPQAARTLNSSSRINSAHTILAIYWPGRLRPPCKAFGIRARLPIGSRHFCRCARSAGARVHRSPGDIRFLGDVPEPILPATGVLPGYQPQPGSKLASGSKQRGISDSGNNGAGGDRPDAGDCLQPAADNVRTMP